jgi:hypothetical protein
MKPGSASEPGFVVLCNRLTGPRGPTTCVWVPQALEFSPSAFDENGMVHLQLHTDDETSCCSATQPFWLGHPATRK